MIRNTHIRGQVESQRGKEKMKLPGHKGLIKVPLQLRLSEQYGLDLTDCPHCKAKTMQLVFIFKPWKQADDDG